MVKDLRTGVEKGNAQGVLDGNIDDFLSAALAARVGADRAAEKDRCRVDDNRFRPIETARRNGATRSSTAVRNARRFWMQAVLSFRPHDARRAAFLHAQAVLGERSRCSSRRSGRCGAMSARRGAVSEIRWYRRFTAISGYTCLEAWGRISSGFPRSTGLIDTFAGSDPYAAVADAYDLGIHRSRSEAERTQRIYDLVGIEPGADILDIGCGTGGLVDFRFKDMDPERYTGIDPSRGMLGVFADKHPEFRNRLVRTRFEDYWPKPGRKFDLVAALFGAPSYLAEPDFVSRKIRWLLKPGGVAVLMYYNGKPKESAIYRNLGIKGRRPQGEPPVSGGFWAIREDDYPDWITFVGFKPG